MDWSAHASGGDGARLADYLLAALHADGEAPTARDELVTVLEQSRSAADRLVEVLVLDAMAALDARDGHFDEAVSGLDTADNVAAAAPFLWAGDRVDSERVRREVAAARPGASIGKSQG